jgi:hypothetical protein
MGILHFAGLGKSPGAVTAGLSYLKHEIGDSVEMGAIVESVVIFTSSAIAIGDEPAYPDTTHNEYMQTTSRKTWTRDRHNVLNIVAEYLHREMGNGPFYVCELDVNDFSACFETVAKATLKFHPPGAVGKHIWANITGGSNVLNAALMQTAYVSGFIARLYYTFVANVKEDGKYLQPFSHDERQFDYREFYVLKTTFDERYQDVLEELEQVQKETPEQWISSQDLLSRLKGKAKPGFAGLSLEAFQRDYLNTMLGVQRKGSRVKGQQDANCLSEDGCRILSLLRSPLFRALTRRDEFTSDEIAALTADLNIRQLERNARCSS